MNNKLITKTILIALIASFVFVGIGINKAEASSCPESDSSVSDIDGYVYFNSEKHGCLNTDDWKYYKVSNSSGKTVNVKVEWSGEDCNKNDLYIYKSNGDQITLKENDNWIKTWEGYAGSDIIIGLDGDSSNDNCQWDLLVVKISDGDQSKDVEINVDKVFKDVSKGDTIWYDVRNVNPGDRLIFRINVNSSGNSIAENVIVRDILPSNIIYLGNLRINDVANSGSIITGVNIGNLYLGQTKTITFDALVASNNNFVYQTTDIINSVLAYNSEDSDTDTSKIIVYKTGIVLASSVSTGLTDNVFFDSFLFPLLIALTLVWLLKSRILCFEQWVDLRKERYRDYKTKKLLQIRIAQIKAKEFFKRK